MVTRRRNANRRLGDRLWDADGVEWTKRQDQGEYHLPLERVSALVSDERLPVALLLDHSAVRWLEGRDAALAVREPLAGQGPLCQNPLGGSLWDEVGGQRRLVLLEEVH